MQPTSKRKIDQVSEVQPLPPAAVARVESQGLPDVGMAEATFDLQGFKIKFDTASDKDRYGLIRDLVNVNKLPISDLQKMISQYGQFKDFKLLPFIEDFKKNPIFACRKHLFSRAIDEMAISSKTFTDKIKAAADDCDYDPDLPEVVNVLGDFFLRDDELDKGMGNEDSLKIFQKTYEIAKSVYGFNHPKMEKVLNELDKWNKRINALSEADTEEPVELVEVTRDMLAEFEKNNELYLQGGWRLKDGGHMVIYRIVRENSKISFEIFNTGDALPSYYHSIIKGTKRLFHPVCRFENVDPLRLTPEFLATLLGNKVVDIDSADIDRSEKDVFDFIKVALNVPFADLKPDETLFITPQRAGTCALRSILALLHVILSEEEYRQFKYFMMEIHITLSYPQLFRSFQKDVVENMYRHIDKLLTEKKITFDQFLRTFSMLSVQNLSPLVITLPAPKLGKLDTNLQFVNPFQGSRGGGAWIFETVVPQLALVTRIDHPVEIFLKLPITTAQLEELVVKYQLHQAYLFHNEVFNSLSGLTDQNLVQLSIPQLNNLFALVNKLKNLYLRIEVIESIPNQKGIYRLYYYTLLFRISKILLDKEFPNHNLSEQLKPYSYNMLNYMTISTVLKPDLRARLKEIHQFLSKLRLQGGWYTNQQGSYGYFLGPETPIVKFIISFLKASSAAQEIPQTYNKTFYDDVLKKKRSLLPDYLYSLLDTYLELFTNTGPPFFSEVHMTHASNPQDGQHFCYRRSKTNSDVFITENFLKYFPANKHFAAPNVRLCSVLMEFENAPELLSDPKAIKKLQHSFFKTVAGHTCLFETELQFKGAAEFVIQLKAQMANLIQIASKNPEMEVCSFLIQFIVQLQKTLKRVHPYSSFSFLDLMTEKLMLPIANKNTFNLQEAQLFCNYLDWCDEKKQFDQTWVKKSFAFLLYYSSKEQNPATHMARLLLRYHSAEFLREFTRFVQEKPDEFAAILAENSLSVRDIVKTEWPYLRFKNGSYHIMNGQWQNQSSEIRTVYPNEDFPPGIKPLFPDATRVIVEEEYIRTEDKRITILRRDPLNPLVKGSKLKEIYGSGLNFIKDDEDYGYIPVEKRQLLHMFQLARFDQWYSQSNPKENFLYDTKTKRIYRILSQLPHPIYHCTDEARGLILGPVHINHSVNESIAHIFNHFAPNKFLIWQSQSSNDIKVEFPTFDLSFTLTESDPKILSGEFEGYYIDLQSLPFPKGSGSSLLLRNANGDRLFIIPKTEFELQGGNVFFPNYMVPEENYLVFQVITHRDKITFEGKKHDLVYLSQYLTMVGDFDEAINLIKKATTNKHDPILEQTLTRLYSSRPPRDFGRHPDNVAYLLHLAYAILLNRNPEDVSNELLGHIYMDLQSYLGNLSNVHVNNRISLAQALLFTHKIAFIGQIPEWQAYLASLKGERYVYSKDQVSPPRSYTVTVPDFLNYTFGDIEQSKVIALYEYRPKENAKDVFLIMFKVLCEGLYTNNQKVIDAVLARAFYMNRTKPSNELPWLIAIINSPNICKGIKKKITPDLLKSKDAQTWVRFIQVTCPLSIEQSHLLKEPTIKQLEEPSETTLEPISGKRKLSAKDFPQAKQPRTTSIKDSKLKELFVEYFRPEVETYPISKLDDKKTPVDAQRIIEQINKDLSSHQSHTIFLLRNPDSLPELKEKLSALGTTVMADIEVEVTKLQSLLKGNLETFDDFKKLLLVEAKIGGAKIQNELFNQVFDQYLKSGFDSFESTELEQSASKYIHLMLTNSIITAALKENNPHKVAHILQRPAGDDNLLDRAVAYYEVVEQKILREKQLKFVSDAQQASKVVLQLPSGEGKTDVITPQLVLTELAKDKTVFVVVPSGNLETDHENLSTALSKFGKRLYLLQFNRNSGQDTVRSIDDALMASKKERMVFICEPSAIQSLFLKYVESLYDPQRERLPIERVEKLERIIAHMRSESSMIGDELQIIFRLLHSLHYAYHTEKGLDPYRWKIPQALYKVMLDYNAKNPPIFPVGKSKGIEFSEYDYHKYQKPFLLKSVAPQIPVDQRWLELFVLSNPLDINNEEREVLNQWKDSLSEELQDQVLLLKAHLDLYLPHCLKARCFVHYGPYKGIETAVPYSGNNQPAPRSLFQNPDVGVNYSNQSAYINGLEPEQVKRLIQFLRRRSVESGMEHSLLERPEAQTDLTITDNLIKIWEIVCKDPDIINDYYNYFVYPDIRVNTERLTSTAYDLSYIIFPRTVAFSATLLTLHKTMPRNYATQFDGQVNAEMINLLSNPEHTSFVVSDDPLAELLWTPDLCMVLDPHHVMEGVQNEAVAKQLLDSGYFSEVKYFDQVSNVMTSVTKADAQIKRTLTYCDEKHTTGVHTIQPGKGVGLILGNKGLTYTEMAQAAKRLREFGKGQKVILNLTKGIEKEILKIFQTDKLTNKLIVFWLLLNESHEADRNTSICFELYLRAIYLNCFITKLRVCAGDQAKFHLADRHKTLSLEEVDIKEYRTHGSLNPPATPLEKFRAKAKQYFAAHGDLLDEDASKELQFLERFAEEYFKVKPNSDAVALSATTQQERQAYKEAQNYMHILKPKRRDDVWNPNDVFETSDPSTIWAKFNPGQKIELAKNLALFPLSQWVSNHDLPGNLFVSDNFLNHPAKLDPVLYKDVMPRIEFILEVRFNNNSNYIVLTKEEASRYRKFAIEMNANNIENMHLKGHLHLLNGRELASNASIPRVLDVRIQAVIKFLNQQTKYSLAERKIIKDWLQGMHTDEKVGRFLRGMRLRGVHQRDLAGSVVESIFDEVIGRHKTQ